MAAVNELSAIPFGALIGGPMTAAIEAQSKAALASVEFIRAVGFDNDGNIHNVVFKYKAGPEESDVQELQVPPPEATAGESEIRATIDRFTWFVYAATLFFFAVLFVGFAYEWKTGAFDWVRAVTAQRAGVAAAAPRAPPAEQQPALSS